MDRGIPTEAVLEEMRRSEPPVQYLVGTPKGRLNRLEEALVTKPWRTARPGVKTKLLPEDGELYVFAESHDRIAKERSMRRREGRYLLRTNLTETDPVKLWNYYWHLVQVEDAFRTLKSDLAIRPIFHQGEERIEAHVFISFIAYCLYVTLGRQLKPLAPGLTARSALEKFAAVQMIDVHIPTTDGRKLLLTRHTQPEPELTLLLERLHFELPAQPPPQLTAVQAVSATAV